MKKAKALAVIAGIYLLSYAVGALVCLPIRGTALRWMVFDAAATVVVFVFSTVLKNSSVYDAYWSLTPMVISVALMVGSWLFSVWKLIFLVVFNLWGLRLTLNWVTVFTDFSYEDWRYRKFRAENTGLMWFIINFFGIHFVPTLIVFAAMLPLFVIAAADLNAWEIPGLAVMLSGIGLEFFADRQMHVFLKQDTEMQVCRQGLWNYSRHPNYLGEIIFWFGVYFVMLPFAPSKWFFCVGAFSVLLLFDSVSIPMMEVRQMVRRSEYAAYRETTARLFLRPHLK